MVRLDLRAVRQSTVQPPAISSSRAGVGGPSDWPDARSRRRHLPLGRLEREARHTVGCGTRELTRPVELEDTTRRLHDALISGSEKQLKCRARRHWFLRDDLTQRSTNGRLIGCGHVN